MDLKPISISNFTYSYHPHYIAGDNNGRWRRFRVFQGHFVSLDSVSSCAAASASSPTSTAAYSRALGSPFNHGSSSLLCLFHLSLPIIIYASHSWQLLTHFFSLFLLINSTSLCSVVSSITFSLLSFFSFLKTFLYF